MKPTSLGVAVALAKEPDRATSVELFISTLPVVTVTPGSTPVGSSPPTPPPDDGQLALYVIVIVPESAVPDVPPFVKPIAKYDPPSAKSHITRPVLAVPAVLEEVL